ncbi:MAG: hypothetical protein Sapg2KO_36860 [Saprospiraceae bacterium]
MKHNYVKWAQALLFMLFLVGVQAQTTVMLPASKDNSLFSENNNSNGGGDDLFTGRTNQGNLRRTLIQFDLSTIPSGATITDAQLKIRGSRQAANAVAIHRLMADWGEGTSVATGQGGQGASPTNNDATWNFSFFNTTSWSTAGGDFMPTASATADVSSGSTSNWTGANVVADVQAWIDDSATNFGWIIIGDESNNNSAVRLVSRESSTNAPELEVTYTVACDANGGVLTFADGSDELTICAGDGVLDPFMVNITDTVGTNFAWVITDANGMILGLPSGPTFDLEGAGAGVCLLWGLSFEDGLTGAAVGNNASDLMGCFDLSNPITVNRNGVDGGVLTFADGSDELTICAGDGVLDPFMVNITDTVGANFAWVITDADGMILGLPSGPTFDLEGAGGGVCLLWGLSFEDGLTGAAVGNNASDLMGCFDLSNPITVNRNGVDGGLLTFADGSDELTICAGDGEADPFMVNITDTIGTNFAWVITDANGMILGLPSGPTFDLEGAGAGVCLLWGLSFEDGLTGAAVGNNASDLMGCFDLSNPITVTRDTTGSICVTSTESVLSAAEIGFEVFPNPAQDRIQFKANFTERPSSLFIEVRSSVGQLMIRKELSNQRELNETLDINQMTSGLYLITLRTERSVITRRFLKE